MPVVLAGLLPFCFVLGSALTYQPVADGDWGGYLRLALFLAGLSLVAYGALRRRYQLLSPWPLAGLLLVLGAGGSLHTLRLAHPVRFGAPLAGLDDRFTGGTLDPRRWQISAPAPARVAVADGVLRLTTPPRVAAFAELTLPPGGREQAWWLRPPASLWLPATFDLSHVAESLTWESAVSRDLDFFVLLDTRPLLLQLTRYGLHLSRSVDSDVAATEVALPALAAGGTHTWQVIRDPSDGTVFVDGRLIWQGHGIGRLEYVRFGETRTDERHGGTLELRHVRYRRWWVA